MVRLSVRRLTERLSQANLKAEFLNKQYLKGFMLSSPLKGQTTQIITNLQRTRDLTISYFSTPVEQLTLTYGPGKWNVRQILHHLTDCETVLYERIRRAISVTDQVVYGFDPDAWAKELNYNELPLELSLDIYKSCREMVLHLAASHYETADQKHFVHNDTGKRTLKDEFDKVTSHNQGHLDQIGQALA